MSKYSMPKKEKERVLRKGYDWRPKFLKALEEYGVVTYAAQAAGVDVTTPYKYRDQSEWFYNKWQDALQIALDKLEVEAQKRARSKSDTLLIFLLKSYRPERFRERYEITGSDGDPMTIRVEYADDNADAAEAA